MLKSDTSSTPLVGNLTKILQPPVVDLKDPLKALTRLEVAKILAAGENIPEFIYGLILNYLHSIGQLQWRLSSQMPHLDNELVLPPAGKAPFEVKFGGHTFSCKTSHEGNSGIQFKHPRTSAILTGYIDQIWQIPLQGRIQTFFVIEEHTRIPQWIAQEAPFLSMPELGATIVDATPSKQFLIIEPEHILTHLTIYKRPKGTYGILTRELLVISWSLNRGRRT
ncbi:hypothetical protein B0H15DRAFT_794632 [Mycena belliarum]|uniref:Uncharacterized protein n=1 Tax=Mycena belliarum TaxID=1033014 RepID=A0AAD6XDC0_9AGAR|nr:hypothetical protein B0H15DRAFT_794632 [Mycena belliae]